MTVMYLFVLCLFKMSFKHGIGLCSCRVHGEYSVSGDREDVSVAVVSVLGLCFGVMEFL